jgi:putative zinc ribbon protein
MGVWGEKDPKGMPSHLFFGSRRLDYCTAQRADVSKQNYSVCPRHWYLDATFICRDCAEEFIFSASEQRFWYEDRHFWIDSLPTRCIPCRKKQRTRLNLRKRYDALIATALGACSVETKKEVVAIINELEAAEDEVPEKMKQNRTILYAQLSKTA